MKTKIFKHKLLAGLALATLGLGFTNGAQAQEAYAVSILKITNFATIFDPLPDPLPDVQGNLDSVTSCTTDLPSPDDNEGDIDAQAFANLGALPPSLNGIVAECGNTNTVRADDNFTPIGPQVFPYGSGDASIPDTNTFGTGEASTIGEAFSNDFSEPIKSFTGNGRNTLASEFELTADTKITFDFDAEFMAFAELMGGVNGQALASAASSINIVVTNIDNPAAPVIVADFAADLAPLAPVADKATEDGFDGSLAFSMQHVTVMTPILAPGTYSVEITMESRATVKVDEEIIVQGKHFLCYKSFGHFLREEVNLFDQFEDKNFKMLKPKMFCNPAIKPELDPDAELAENPHYLSYKIKKGHRVERHVSRMAEVTNQFGTMIVETIRPDRLMVPSGKSLDLDFAAPVPPPGPMSNHYKCYTIRATMQPFDVVVKDQFTDADGKNLTLVRAKRLCTPVEKTRIDDQGNESVTPIIEDPNNEFDHLMCYMVRAANGEKLHKKTKVLSSNQFRDEELVLKRELEFCVPSIKRLLPPEG